MQKLVGGIIIVLVLAATGFVGAAYWSGIQAEHWYQDALTEGSKNPNIKFTTERYERGLFVSHAVTRVQLTLPEGSELKDANPSFAVREDIYHGPLPLAGRNVPGVPMHWNGAVIRATLDVESSTWIRELAKLYGGQEPIEVISQVSFDGASDTQITMPSLTLSNVDDLQSLNFSGLQGQFQAAPHGAAIRGKMTVTGLEVVSKPTASEGQSTDSGNQAKFSHLIMTVDQHKGAFDLMFGGSSFKVGELRVQDQATGSPVVFTNLGIDATASLDAKNKQQVAIEALFKADQITANKRSGSGSLRLALRNLDGATVAQLQQWQQKQAGKPDDPQALDELLKLVEVLLVGKPELTLDTQAKLINEGEWQGKLVLNFQDFDMTQVAQNPMGLLAALEKGLGDVVVSKTLLETELNNMMEGKAAQQLQSMTAAGFIRLEGDQYKSTVRFEGNKLLVNNQEIPLALTTNAGNATGEEDAAGEENATGEDAAGEENATGEEDAPQEPEGQPATPVQQ